ncbi:helix-turn-helix transcriptional regulator [Nocardioides sp. AN3]
MEQINRPSDEPETIRISAGTSTHTPSGSTSTGAVVVHGAFEPALSLKELAAELQVTCQTLYDLRSQGRGPAGFRIGRHLRFRRSEIQAWLERLEQADLERHPRDGAR